MANTLPEAYAAKRGPGRTNRPGTRYGGTVESPTRTFVSPSGDVISTTSRASTPLNRNSPPVVVHPFGTAIENACSRGSRMVTQLDDDVPVSSAAAPVVLPAAEGRAECQSKITPRAASSSNVPRE